MNKVKQNVPLTFSATMQFHLFWEECWEEVHSLMHMKLLANMICQYSDSCIALELSDGKLCNSAAIEGKVTAQCTLLHTRY